MNTDNNLRFRETEARIFQAYGKFANTKKLSRITVADICREAGIHRTTFYGHFQDIPDLETKILKKQFYNFYQAFFNAEGGWSYYDGTLHLVEFFGSNRETIKRHLSDASCDMHPGILMDESVILKHMDAYMRAFHCKSEQEVWYHQLYFCHGMLAILRTWITGGCKESVEEITAMITKFSGIESRQ